jgi:PST family polysaccharide transporter
MDVEDVDPTDEHAAGDSLGPASAPPSQPVSREALASGATSLTLSQAFQFVFRSVIAVVLAHFIAPADFGLLGLVTVVTGLLDRTVSDSGLVNALVHRLEVPKSLASSVFYFNIATGALIAASLALAASPLASLVGTARAVDVFRGLSITFLIAGFTHVPEAMLRRSFRYGSLALSGGINALFTGLTAIPLAIAGHGIASLVIGSIVGVTAEAVSGFALSRWRPHLHFRLSEVRSLSSYSGHYTAFHFVNYFSDSGDKFVVGRFVGQAALGFYSVPYRLVYAPILALAQVFRDLFFSVFVRKQHDPEGIGREYIRAVSMLAALTFPFCALISALGTPIVTVVLGREWIPAGPIVTVMSLVVLLQSVLVTTGLLLTATGRTNVLLRWGLGSGIAMMVCYSVGAFWGTMGVATGFLIGTILLTYPAIAIPFRYLGCSVWTLTRALVPAAIATAAGAAVAVAARVALEARDARPITVMLIGLVLGSVTYLGVLLVQKPRIVDDARLLLATRFGRQPAVAVGDGDLR